MFSIFIYYVLRQMKYYFLKYEVWMSVLVFRKSRG